MRTVKDAKERRNEILDAAENLFINKGYGKSTIVDILEAVGIAKGTFYYYFKSKEEVMDAIINRVVENDMEMAIQISRDTSMTPVQKIIAILMAQQPSDGGSKELLIEQFHRPDNADMHQKSITRSTLTLAPVLADVVKQGISEGLFHTDYPQEMIELLILSGQNLFDRSSFQWTPEDLEQKINAFITAMELLLGAEKGSFSHMWTVLTGTEKNGGTDAFSQPGAFGRADRPDTAPGKELYETE